MGFLKVFGNALEYEDSKKFFQRIRDQGIDQIIILINNTLSRKSDNPKFGYELEFHKIEVNDQSKTVKIDLSAENDIFLFNTNTEREKDDFILQHEYGKWMIEVVPKSPFEFEELWGIQDSLNKLYKHLEFQFGKNKILSISPFPTLGASKDYFTQNHKFLGEESEDDLLIKNTQDNLYSKSVYFNDICINRHPRFGTISRNVRQRRGKNVDIRIPIYKDKNTDNITNEPYKDTIHMDAMGFGMGSCCFQVTLGCRDLEEASFINDQFISLSPLLIALTASSPFFKGKLSGIDSRFDVISQSVDDRTDNEKDPNSSRFINKSRYGPAYSYLSSNDFVQEFHNDNPKFPVNEEYLKKLISGGIPVRLAEHICNLFVRDPLVIFDQKIEVNEKDDFSHFENLQTTNWNNVRFKPPRIDDNDSCFKIEVRPCELQFTPFENAAIGTFIVILYKLLLKFNMNFIIPISCFDENMRRSYNNDSVVKEKFLFRTNYFISKTRSNSVIENSKNLDASYFDKEKDKEHIKELTLHEIFNETGLLDLMLNFVDDEFKNENERIRLKNHLKFLNLRTKGSLMTDAQYMRNFVLNHPKYKGDSVISEEINYDLISHVLDIQNGILFPETLLLKDLIN